MSKTLDKAAPQIDVATIVQHGDKLILPDGMPIDDCIKLLERRLKYDEEMVAITADFNVFPWDGARALMSTLAKRFGWAASEPTQGFFGPNPPQMISIDTGPRGQKTSVPWGQFSMPGVYGHLQTTLTKKKNRLLFALSATVKRKHEATIEAIFADVQKELDDDSIYRGKAIKMRFCDDDGDPLSMPEPEFIDVSAIDPDSLIYSDDVQSAINTNLFAVISRARDCLANGISLKRGVLLCGSYGTGKTMAAAVAARLAVDSAISYLYVQRASELGYAVEFARQYQSPACVVFCEDMDRSGAGERTVEMDEILNIIDGIDGKDSNIIIVLTTNDPEAINPAFLRPGRLDAVIHVTPPDAKAIEKLMRHYGQGAIAVDTKLDKAAKILAEQQTIPAVVAEVVKRAKLAQLHQQPAGTLVTDISEQALLEAADSMRMQLELLHRCSRPAKPQDGFGVMMQSIVRGAIGEDLGQVKDLMEKIKSEI